MGFCWGGGMSNQVAANSPELVAAVPYYGMQPAAEDVPRIKASLLLHYAGEDQRINQGIPAFEAALKKAGVDYKLYMYEGAEHAFNNDTNEQRYNPAAAKLAWERTMGVFKGQTKNVEEASSRPKTGSMGTRSRLVVRRCIHGFVRRGVN